MESLQEAEENLLSPQLLITAGEEY